MISRIIPEKNKEWCVSRFDLPVIVFKQGNPGDVVVLTHFHQRYENENNSSYSGYYIGEAGDIFDPITIYDDDIENWSKFRGEVVLSNFVENK
jgi:hypothetical protein